MCVHVCMYACMYVRMYKCMGVCMGYICMCVCMRVMHVCVLCTRVCMYSAISQGRFYAYKYLLGRINTYRILYSFRDILKTSICVPTACQT